MPHSYWLRVGRRTEGPLSIDELRRRACRGGVTPAHSVSRDRKTWIAARRCTELYGQDGLPVAPSGADVVETVAEDEAGSDAWPDVESLAPSPADGLLPPARAADRLASAWPALAACAMTLAVACGLPVARNAEGPLWWWNLMGLAELRGAPAVIAALAWSLVSALAIAAAAAVWWRGSAVRSAVLVWSAAASVVLATLAWSVGMATGAWTAIACLAVPASGWMIVRSAERQSGAHRVPNAVRHPWDTCLSCAAATGILSAMLAIVSLCVREGGAALAGGMLLILSGAGLSGTVALWRLRGPDEWTTLVPCGTLVIACGAILCDGIAALSSTPVPPVEGTRYAVLDSVRVSAALLSQSAVAYLAALDRDSAHRQPATTPPPGQHHT